MEDFTGYENVSEALIRYAQNGWADESESQIAGQYGDDVAAKAKFVYEAAMDCPVDWRTADMDEALGILANFLTTRFSWLTPEARRFLNYRYIMCWK